MSGKPNFFIVGAPKCGTTALYEYLRHHPNIFLPKVKEPHFFATDLGAYPSVKTMDQYLGLFHDSNEAQVRIGEASVYYLRSDTALPKIREFNPAAHIIAMFRNPVEMVHALHSQLLYVGIEDVPDFEAAWRLQDPRSRGLHIPPRIRSPLLLQYREMARFGTQAERLLSLFPPEQVKLIVYDDFAASPQQIYDEVIAFLGIPHDHRTEFPRINENKRARVAWLRDFSRKPPPLLHKAFRGLKRATGGDRISAIKKKISALNTVRGGREPLSSEFRAELVKEFEPQILLLSQILGRDLTYWR